MLHDLLQPHFSQQLLQAAAALEDVDWNVHNGADLAERAHRPWDMWKDINCFDDQGLMTKPLCVIL